MNDQWLNQMEMSTYTPDVSPMWARPDISMYEIEGEGKGGGDGGGGAEKSTTPWFWKMPIQGQQLANDGPVPILAPDDVDDGVVRVVQIAMENSMFG